MNGLRELADAVTTRSVGSTVGPISISLRQVEVRPDVSLAADLMPGHSVVRVEASHVQPTAHGNPLDDLDAVFASLGLPQLPRVCRAVRGCWAVDLVLANE
jgi:hypothetical protein